MRFPKVPRQCSPGRDNKNGSGAPRWSDEPNCDLICLSLADDSTGDPGELKVVLVGH